MSACGALSWVPATCCICVTAGAPRLLCGAGWQRPGLRLTGTGWVLDAGFPCLSGFQGPEKPKPKPKPKPTPTGVRCIGGKLAERQCWEDGGLQVPCGVEMVPVCVWGGPAGQGPHGNVGLPY